MFNKVHKYTMNSKHLLNSLETEIDKSKAEPKSITQVLPN